MAGDKGDEKEKNRVSLLTTLTLATVSVEYRTETRLALLFLRAATIGSQPLAWKIEITSRSEQNISGYDLVTLARDRSGS